MRHKLSLGLEEDEQLVATVYGVISDLPDYRLVFMINQELGLRLKRCEEDRKLYHKAGVIHAKRACSCVAARATVADDKETLAADRHIQSVIGKVDVTLAKRLGNPGHTHTAT